MPQRRIWEKMHWHTDVFRSRGAEQRVSLRQKPRTSVELRFHLKSQEIEAATFIARKYQTTGLYVPLWQDLETINSIDSGDLLINFDTRFSRYKSGSFAFIIDANNNYEFVIIASVSDSSINFASPGVVANYRNCKIMPAYLMLLESSFAFNKRKRDCYVADCEFITDEDFNISGQQIYSLYNRKEVLSDRSIASNRSNESHENEFSKFGNIAGKLYHYNLYNHPASSSSVSWNFQTKEKLNEFKKWMYHVKGRQRSFYLPRWTSDFELEQNILATDSSLAFEPNPIKNNEYVGAICILKKDKSTIYSYIISWESNRANLSDAIGQAVNLSEVDLICRMSAMRFNSDVIELNYQNKNDVRVSLPVFEVRDCVTVIEFGYVSSDWEYQITAHSDAVVSEPVPPVDNWISNGVTPFGGGPRNPTYEPVPPNTSWSTGTILWLRKTFPAGIARTLDFSAIAENGARIFINDVEVYGINVENSQLCLTRTSLFFI